jgi:hypothetical protein
VADGWLRALAEVSRETDGDVTVLDSDLVVPHVELCEFLRNVAERAPEEELVVGTAREPPSTDARSIRFAVDERGDPILLPGEDASAPRAAGAYHWRAKTLTLARDFVASTSGTFHEFSEHLVARCSRIGLFEFSAAVNVNAHDDLELARAYVRDWQALGLEEDALVRG